MSARFWLFSCACAGAALTGGLGLGFYASTPPRMAWSEAALPKASVQQGGDDTALAGMNGPAIIHCKGCGPALADRRRAADMEGWDGMNDPAVRAYEAQDEMAPASYAEPVEAVQTQIAPPQSKTSAEEAPADAAIPY